MILYHHNGHGESVMSALAARVWAVEEIDFMCYKSYGILVEDSEQTTPLNKLAPPFPSLRLLICLSLSLAFCSWPGVSLQHLKVHGQPDSLASGSEHWEPGKCKAQQSGSWAGAGNKAVSPCQNKSYLSSKAKKEKQYPCAETKQFPRVKIAAIWLVNLVALWNIELPKKLYPHRFCPVKLLRYGFILVVGFLFFLFGWLVFWWVSVCLFCFVLGFSCWFFGFFWGFFHIIIA